ncbi:Scr1 family TA system antitoxin-like transcriptional regulator [Nocardia sp. NPDC059764]|uniref:Scr1 family TA system antitoxin-like transcriptional regulator n=1 Tax=Nocardia sp. NPDC059764 TaxID=3346939 RepID=UPI003660EFB6
MSGGASGLRHPDTSPISRPGCVSRWPGLEPTVVFAENYTGGMYFEERGDIDRCRAAHRTLTDAALEADISRSLLREMARRFESER